ncbi:hypothetical protein ACLOJK_035062 [Asimina triloba]
MVEVGCRLLLGVDDGWLVGHGFGCGRMMLDMGGSWPRDCWIGRKMVVDFGRRYRPALLGVESDGCNCLGVNGLSAGRTLEVDRADERTGGRVCGLLAVAHRRRRVTKGCCPSPFEVFASEIGCSLAGSEMLALSPSFWTALISHGRRRRRGRWDRIQRVVLVIVGGLDRASSHPARARRRQPWLPTLVRVMEHRNWCSGGVLQTVYLQCMVDDWMKPDGCWESERGLSLLVKARLMDKVLFSFDDIC